MMLVAVLILFLIAGLSPLIYRATRSAAGWLLAIIPTGICIWASVVFYQISGVAPGSSVGNSGGVASGAGGVLTESYSWVPSLGVNFSMRLDGLSMVFVLLICGIGALILIYAGSYLHDDRRLGRFYAYLMVFMGAMLGLVLSDNLLAMFVFWELTSISSYFLIGWDHQQDEARQAAWTSLLVTSGGGLMLLAGLVLLTQVSGQMDISRINPKLVQQSSLYLPILLLVFAGAATKSALTPFHFWLPRAMAAPTPVSAYLHAATMVKAGIYLLARLHPILGGTVAWFELLTLVGCVTMLTGGVGAVLQKDLKRILAYSTVCVLGTLTMLLGIGTETAINAAVIYLVAHALYKGALFMGAGTLDHETSTRDITELQGLARLMPISAAVAVLAAASNAGVLPLLGFISHEMLFDATWTVQAASAEVWSILFLSVAFISSVLLVVVGFMVGYRPYFGGKANAPRQPHEAALPLWLGGVVLAGLSLVLGCFPWLLGDQLGSAAAGAVLGQEATMTLVLWHGPTLMAGLSALTLGGGAILFFLTRSSQGVLCEVGQKLHSIGPARWYDLSFAGLMNFSKQLSGVLQNGYLRNYVLVIVSTLILLVAWPIAQTLPYLRAVDPGPLRMTDVVLAGVIIIAAIAANRIRSRMAIVAILGCIGLSVMLIYIVYGAMDLALTQIMVETLTVVLLVLVIYHLPRLVPSSSKRVLVRDAVVSLIFGGVMTTLVLMSATLHPNTTMRSFFVENSFKLGHGRNIVNVILTDFRAMDTFGEIVVLAVAGIGVFALLKIRVKKEK